MSQSHVTGTQLIEYPDHAQVAADGMASFYTNETGNLALGHGILNVLGSLGKVQVIWVHVNQPFGNIHLLNKVFQSINMGTPAAGPHRPELRMKL